MAEKPRDLGDFKRWVILRLTFRLKSYASHQHLCMLDRGMDYNFALEFFTQTNFVADFIRLKLIFV